jgi:hypothetical protein
MFRPNPESEREHHRIRDVEVARAAERARRAKEAAAARERRSSAHPFATMSSELRVLADRLDRATGPCGPELARDASA